MLASRWLVRRVHIFSKNLLPSAQRRWQITSEFNVPPIKCFSSTLRLNCSSSSIANVSLLNEKIKEMRKDLMKSGKLSSLQMLDDILCEIDKGEKLSPEDALLLISSCDSIANSTQTKQIDSLKRVVKSLEVNHSLSIRHYNRVLEISLKNPKRFNVSQFIDKLQQDGVKINDFTSVLLQKLLNSYVTDGNAIESDRILRELIKSGRKCSKLEQYAAQIIGLYVQTNNLSPAMELYSLIQAKSIAFTLDQWNVMELINFLIGNDRINDALELAEHIKQGHASFNSFKKWKTILTAIEGRCTESEYEKLIVLLLSKKVILANGNFLAPLIHRHLVAGNIEKAVQLFYNYSGTYRITPCLKNILVELIERKSVDHLERVVTIALELNGKICLYDLACAFIECNRIVEAKNIFKKLACKTQSPTLQSMVDHFYKIGEDECLERILTAVGDDCHVDDRNYILEKLLIAQCRRNDSPDEILSFCDEMTSIPSAESLQNLNYYLLTHNRSLPDKWIEYLQSTIPKDDHKSQLHEMIAVGDKLSEAKATIFQALESNGEIRLERRELRYFLSTYVTTGDVDTFDKLRTKLDTHTQQQLHFSKFDCRIHIAANRGGDYLQLMSNEAIAANTNTKKKNLSLIFPLEAYEILEKCPELCEKFEEMAVLYVSKNVLKPMCLLWLHHLFCNNVNACQRLYENYKLSDVILCKSGTRLFFTRKDAIPLKSLSEKLDKQKVPRNVLAKLFDGLLVTHLYHNHLDQIAVELKNALQFVSLRDIRQQTLDKIRFGGKDLADAQKILLSKSNK